MSAHTGNTVREPEPEPTFIEILSNIILFLLQLGTNAKLAVMIPNNCMNCALTTNNNREAALKKP